jgi:hypothetical protein
MEAERKVSFDVKNEFGGIKNPKPAFLAPARGRAKVSARARLPFSTPFFDFQ